MSEVIYKESPIYNITTKLREKGYTIADCCGIRVDQPDSSCIGILKDRNSIQKRFLGIKWNSRQRALFLGILWIDNEIRNAIEDEKWILEIYGKDNAKELISFIKEISAQYKVEIEAKVVSGYEYVETCMRDYMD